MSGVKSDKGPECPAGHRCSRSTYDKGAYRGGFTCDICGDSGPPKAERWHCRKCQADMCYSCSPPTLIAPREGTVIGVQPDGYLVEFDSKPEDKPQIEAAESEAAENSATEKENDSSVSSDDPVMVVSRPHPPSYPVRALFQYSFSYESEHSHSQGKGQEPNHHG